MTKLKQNFIKTAHLLWSAEDGLFDATDIDAMLSAWLINQSATTYEAKVFIEETMDAEKLSDFNEKCNHNGLRLSQTETYFEEVYEAWTDEEIRDARIEEMEMRKQQYS
jgi:hypothetical protein